MDLFIPPLHPGPIDSSVLHLQSNHPSRSVWNDQNCNPIINLSKYNRGIYVEVVQDERVCGYLKKAGFYGVAYLGKIVLNHSLIIALVERWRPEVYAFHLPFGEVGITLQDVEVLLGLRVDGKPVTGPVQRSKDEWYNRLETLLGIQPKLKVLTECKIGASGLPVEITLKPDSPILEVQRATRLLILHIFGGLLFADTTQSKVPLYLLDLLEDFDSAGEYSWGSAVLAYLYRTLCRGVHFQSLTMGRCLVLLQLWAWERLPLVRPGKVIPLSDLGDKPYGARWAFPHKFDKVTKHTVRAYRDGLDITKARNFNYTPYPLDMLAPYCRASEDIWSATVPLIYFYIVEHHYPLRLCRQFGFVQGIPPTVTYSSDLHVIDLRASKTDWADKHKSYIEEWEQHHIHVNNTLPRGNSATEEYVLWYHRIGRRLVGNHEHCPEFGYVQIAGRTSDGVLK